MTVKEGSVALDVRIAQRGPETLQIRYRLANSGPAIYVLDQILNRDDGRRGPDPARVYTIVTDNSQLVLLKGLLPVPDGMQVELPEVPYARFLDANSQIADAFDIQRTLAYDNPYDYESRGEVIEIRRAVLRVGFVPADAVAERGQEIKIAGKTLFRFRYRDLIGHQRFLEYPLGEMHLRLRR
jgi:hypothetical protein